MLKKIIKSIMGSQSHRHYSSSDRYHRRPRHYSSSDRYKRDRYYDSRSHSKYGHQHYKRKRKSFFSSFSSS
ncbi:hypothetical protein FZC66_04880 [Priestia megaterium]|nr:hypothetical protein FZC66_04880 [Priestia megaterium]